MTDLDTRGWRNSLRRHDVLVFMLAALILTWVVWVPRAMGAQVGVIGQLWTWIPAMTALGCAAVLYGRAGVRDLGRRLVLWRVRWWWYPVVLLGPLVFALIVAGIAVLLGEPWDAARPPALTLSIPALGLTLLILALTDGLGEELGWRGYLLPRLLIRHRAFAASLILGSTGGCGTSRRSGLRVARWRANRRGCCSLTFWPSRCFSPMCFWARRAAC
jgi:uncharacterized protein